MQLRYVGFRQLTRSRTGAAPIDSRSALASATVALMRGMFPLGRKVRLPGVNVSGFEKGERPNGSQIAFDSETPD